MPTPYIRQRQPIPAGHPGEKVTLLRGRRGLLQAELAELAPVSVDTIRRLEQGRFTPSPSTLERIATALNTTLDYLTTPLPLAPPRATPHPSTDQTERDVLRERHT